MKRTCRLKESNMIKSWEL